MPTPKNHEVFLADDEFIVSKTDPKGRITYVNRVFMRIAGYSEQQLLDQPHSIIRHPDMPRGVFHFLWKTLQENKEFFGYVKNLCADGSFYWVMANVTPDFDANETLTGYYSVRRKVSEKAKSEVTPIYQEMLKLEQNSSAPSAPKISAEYLFNLLEKNNVSYEEFVFSLT